MRLYSCLNLLLCFFSYFTLWYKWIVVVVVIRKRIFTRKFFFWFLNLWIWVFFQMGWKRVENILVVSQSVKERKWLLEFFFFSLSLIEFSHQPCHPNFEYWRMKKILVCGAEWGHRFWCKSEKLKIFLESADF